MVRSVNMCSLIVLFVIDLLVFSSLLLLTVLVELVIALLLEFEDCLVEVLSEHAEELLV